MDPAAALAPLETGYAAALAGSDLDLVVTVVDRDSFAATETWGFLDPVIRLPIPGLPGSLALVTRAGLRVDVVVESVADLPATPHRHRIEVFDRDGLAVPAPAQDATGPDAALLGDHRHRVPAAGCHLPRRRRGPG